MSNSFWSHFWTMAGTMLVAAPVYWQIFTPSKKDAADAKKLGQEAEGHRLSNKLKRLELIEKTGQVVPSHVHEEAIEIYAGLLQKADEDRANIEDEHRRCLAGQTHHLLGHLYYRGMYILEFSAVIDILDDVQPEEGPEDPVDVPIDYLRPRKTRLKTLVSEFLDLYTIFIKSLNEEEIATFDFTSLNRVHHLGKITDVLLDGRLPKPVAVHNLEGQASMRLATLMIDAGAKKDQLAPELQELLD